MVKEIEELKESADEFAEDLAEVTGGIFDEDIEEVDGDEFVSGIFDEDIEEVDGEASTSDFNIGNTMLTAALPVESWAGQNLEETLSRDWVKKDWDDEEDAFSGNFYKSSDGRDDVYGAKNDVYSSTGRGGNDVYGAVSGGSESGSYDSKSGTYDTKSADIGALKSHDQLRDEQRGGSSILDIVGAGEKSKQKRDDFRRDFVAYEGKDVA